MSDDFWPSAIRDFALLIAGSLFTLLGVWLTNAAAAKREQNKRAEDRADAKLDRDREAIKVAQESINALWVHARDELLRSNGDQVRFPRDLLTTAESSVYLVSESKTRETISKALAAIHGLYTPVNWGYLDREPSVLQRQILVSAIQVLSALLRGDVPPEQDMKVLQEIGRQTEAAWRDAEQVDSEREGPTP